MCNRQNKKIPYTLYQNILNGFINVFLKKPAIK